MAKKHKDNAAKYSNELEIGNESYFGIWKKGKLIFIIFGTWRFLFSFIKQILYSFHFLKIIWDCFIFWNIIYHYQL
jgi:hypothetical protein